MASAGKQGSLSTELSITPATDILCTTEDESYLGFGYDSNSDPSSDSGLLDSGNAVRRVNSLPAAPSPLMMPPPNPRRRHSTGSLEQSFGVKATARMILKELWQSAPHLLHTGVSNAYIGLDWLCMPVGLKRVRRFVRAKYAQQLEVSAPVALAEMSSVETCAVPGGGSLHASLLLPEGLPGPFPTVIMRTPYGRNAGEFGQTLLAERGFAVLVQDTRGRFGSDGTFVPIKDEREDGAATVAWALKQPWCNGRIGVTGISYLGFTAWAAMGTAGPSVQAGVIIMSQARVKRAVLHPDGAISLELCLLWLYLVQNLMSCMQQGIYAFLHKLVSGVWKETLKTASLHLPVCELDHFILEKDVDFWRQGLQSFDDPSSTFWEDKDLLCEVTKDGPPVHIISGWYDIFFDQCLEDFQRAGSRARLTVLPCCHFGILAYDRLMNQVLLDHFQEHLQGSKDASAGPRVQVSVLGSEDFAVFDSWPPASEPMAYYLTGLGLSPTTAGAWQRSYSYNPADPTPARGGPTFHPIGGERDQAPIEARRDVLTFTTEALDEDILVAGAVALHLEVKVGSKSADFVGRLCDVSPEGVSLNRCEGLARVRGPGRRDVSVSLGNTCCLFRKGHRIRLHVCSGAHPRWMRNLQTGERPLATATKLVAATHVVLAGSKLQLPVVPTLLPLPTP